MAKFYAIVPNNFDMQNFDGYACKFFAYEHQILAKFFHNVNNPFDINYKMIEIDSVNYSQKTFGKYRIFTAFDMQTLFSPVASFSKMHMLYFVLACSYNEPTHIGNSNNNCWEIRDWIIKYYNDEENYNIEITAKSSKNIILECCRHYSIGCACKNFKISLKEIEFSEVLETYDSLLEVFGLFARNNEISK